MEANRPDGATDTEYDPRVHKLVPLRAVFIDAATGEPVTDFEYDREYLIDVSGRVERADGR